VCAYVTLEWQLEKRPEQSGGENMLGLKLLYALRVTINLYKHKIIIIHLLKDHVYMPTTFVFKSL